MQKRIPLSVPNLKGNELKYVSQAIEEEWVSTAGQFIVDFEEKMSKYVGVPSAVACQSGTAGLHLALQVCGVLQGDLVIVPTLTFVAAVNPVRYLGAEPIFMDCDDSLTMDAEKLQEFCETQCELIDDILTHRETGKYVRAIVVVHVFGNMADMEAIIRIANRFHLKVVEDATEALGTYYTSGMYSGKFAGTIGDIGVYSFNGNKIITTGGGGMIVSNNLRCLDECKHLSTQAKSDMVYFDHDEVGYNYRMTNVQAAIGLAQLEQLEDFIAIKKRNYEMYRGQGIPLLDFRQDIRSNYWFYSYITEDRDECLVYLDERMIQTRPIWKLIHTLKPYENNIAYRIEKATWYYERVLNLPCSSNLLEEDVMRVSKIIVERNHTSSR